VDVASARYIMGLGSSCNATIRRPRDGSLRCGVYRVEIVAVDTSYRASDSKWFGTDGILTSSAFGKSRHKTISHGFLQCGVRGVEIVM